MNSMSLDKFKRISTERLRALGMPVIELGSTRIIGIPRETYSQQEDTKCSDNQSNIVYLVCGLSDSIKDKHLIEQERYEVIERKPFGLIQLMVKRPVLPNISGRLIEYKPFEDHARYTYFRAVTLNNKGEVVTENITTSTDDMRKYDESFITEMKEQKSNVINYIIANNKKYESTKDTEESQYGTLFPILRIEEFEKHVIACFGLPMQIVNEAYFIVFNRNNGEILTYGIGTASIATIGLSSWYGVAKDGIVVADMARRKLELRTDTIAKDVQSYEALKQYVHDDIDRKYKDQAKDYKCFTK